MTHAMLFALVLIICCTTASAEWSRLRESCRTIPGDSSWPSDNAWSALNSSVGGKLIRNAPIAAVCHGDGYDEKKCNRLRDNWFFPETHLSSPSSPMHYQASNDSCSPFTDRDSTCTIGSHVVYTVNATSVADVEAAISFVRVNNIRLVIRNTGHDYMSRSSGAHALAIWVRNIKLLELVTDFVSESYRGPAIRVGAGEEGGAVQEFAHAHGFMVVAGNCPTVALAGGYIQGGGHGPLSSLLGLAADQLLQIEVLTSRGDLLVATPSQKEDLFWALAGGGGGTYGIVISITVKAFPEVHTSTAFLTVPRTEDSHEAIEEVMTTFFQALPAIVDSGVFLIWALLPAAFLITPAFGPNLTQVELDALLDPTISKLNNLGLGHQYTSTQYADFQSAFTSTPQQWNVSNSHPVGRLIPRKLISTNLPELLNGIDYLASESQAMAVGVSYNFAPHAPPHPISVNPLLRSSIFNLVSGMYLNYSDSVGWKATEQRLVHEFMGPVRKLAPESGAYLHEANPLEPNWQVQFYGGNYEKLLAVKDKYDPDDLLYVPTGVGSHRWHEAIDGRLCRSRVDEGSHHSEL